MKDEKELQRLMRDFHGITIGQLHGKLPNYTEQEVTDRLERAEEIAMQRRLKKIIDNLNEAEKEYEMD